MKKHEAVYERVRRRIADGTLAAGERLPSVRAEARSSGASINTVVRAYERLSDEGWIRTRPRGGCFVRARSAVGGAFGAPKVEFAAPARLAGERLDQAFERFARLDPSFAVAAPGADLLPAEQLGRAFSALDRSWIEYADPAGDIRLRRRIALASEPSDGPTRPEDIVVTNGATEALALVLAVVLSPGDAVAVEAPTYFNFFRQLAPAGAEIVEIPVGPDGMDLDALERALADRETAGARPVKAIIAQPNVQNPTGVSMGEEAKRRLAAIARCRGIYLVQDDVYGDLLFAERRARNLSAFGDYPKGVLVSSYSKTIAPGLRIGWIRSPGLASRFAEEKLRLSMESCRAGQAALASFVGTAAHRKHLASVRTALARRVEDHLAVLADTLPSGSSAARPSGGCLLWIALPEGTDATAVFERAAGKGLVAAPGELFSANPFFRNCLRINAGRALTAERAAALARLAAEARR